MRVLPDTPVWSAALRRPDGQENSNRRAMEALLAGGAVEMIGPIRQELLSGIRDAVQFEKVRTRLRVFKDLPILPDDYEAAAAFYNLCRQRGIQGSSTDFLICSVAVRLHLLIFTEDRDFLNYEKVLPIRLYTPGSLSA